MPYEAGPPWVRSILRHVAYSDPAALRQAEAEAADRPAVRALIQAYARKDPEGLAELDAALENTPWPEPERLALRVLLLGGEARARERAAGPAAGRRERARSEWMLAFALWRTGELEEAESRYAEVVKRYQALPPTEGGDALAGILGDLGMMRYGEGRIAEALAAYEWMARVASGPERDASRGHALAMAGDCLRNLGRHREAEAADAKAFRVFEKAGDRLRAATVLSVRGDMLRERGRYRRAERCCRRAVAMLEEAGPEAAGSRLPQALDALGRVLMARERNPEAEDVFRRVLLLRADAPPHENAYLLYNLGRVQDARGKLAEAERSFERSAAMYGELADAGGGADGAEDVRDAAAEVRAGVLLALGRVRNKLGKHEQTKQPLLRALAHWEREGASATGVLAQTHLELGEMYHALGRYDDAERSLEAAVAVYAAGGAQTASVVARLQSLLGDAARSRGRYDHAERLLTTALAGFGALPRRQRKIYAVERARAYLHLARTLYDLGRYDEAVRPLRRAAATYSTGWLITGMPLILGNLQAWRANGEWQKMRGDPWMRAFEVMLMRTGTSRRYFGTYDQLMEIGFDILLPTELLRYRSFYSEVGATYCRLALAAGEGERHAQAFRLYCDALGTLGRFTYGRRMAGYLSGFMRTWVTALLPVLGWTRRARSWMLRWCTALIVRDQLARMLLEERQFETAERVLRMALPVFHEHGSAEELAGIHYRLGNLQREQGQDAEAVETYRIVIAGCDRAGTAEAARLAALARVGVAEACLRQERYAEAEAAGLEVARGVPEPWDEARTVRAAAAAAVGEAQARRGLRDEAAATFRAALDALVANRGTELTGVGFSGAVLARLHAGLAGVLHAQGDATEAEALYRKALVHLYEVNHAFHAWDVARVQMELGAVLRAAGRAEEALAEWTGALERVERHRAGLRSPGARKHLADRFAADYRRVVALCLELGRPLDAWHWAERGKARGLLDRLENARPRLTAAQARLYEAWADAERALKGQGTAALSPGESAADVEQALRRQLLYEVGSAFVQVDVPAPQDLAAHLAALAGGRRVLFLQLVPLPEVGGGEPECDPYVVFALPLHEVDAGAPISLHAVPLRVEKGAVGGALRMLEDAVDDLRGSRFGAAEDAFDGLVARLGSVLVQPLLRELELLGIDALAMDALLLVPGGDLHALPLHAATLAGGEPLLARVPVCCLGSAGAARGLAERLASARGRVGPEVHMAMGPASAELEEAVYETEVVADAWRARDAVTERCALEEMRVDALVRHAGAVRMLHLAGHSEFDADDPLRSWIAFHGEQLTLGRLISDPSLDFAGMRLCYLSGCDSGLTAGRRSEELEGLVWAFVHAGAWAVHASLWPVEDAVSHDYARVFYERLAAGGDVALAARDATLAVRAMGGTDGIPRDKPLYWAPFALYGNGFQNPWDEIPGAPLAP
jgi:tetratricopeptide (TPR) repeat protein